MFFFFIAFLFLQQIKCGYTRLPERIPEFSISDKEIRDLANVLRQQDVNKASQWQIRLDYQGHTTTRNTRDQAPNRLFENVDPNVYRGKSTYEAFIALMDNYDEETGHVEDETAVEKREVDAFLDTVMNTSVWRTLYQFLVNKRHAFATDLNTFRSWIRQLWFVGYSRARGVADSSGFEHVFMGETKNGEVLGLHNWFRFYMLEQNVNEQFDYKGFLVKRHKIMAAVKFSWRNKLKSSGSFVIGSSPEYDMAIYTFCFLSRRGRRTCNIELDGCPMSITSYELVQQNKVFIGTIYPSAGSFTDSCRNYSE